MPIRKNNPNDRMAAQTPPPRTGTADSGYYGNDRDEDAARPQSGGAERAWEFNGARPRRRSLRRRAQENSDVVELDRTAEESRRGRAEDVRFAEESRVRLAEEARVQRERQAALQIAVDQRTLAEQEAA